jgi:hypothetical protein
LRPFRSVILAKIRAHLQLTMARFGGALDGDVFRVEISAQYQLDIRSGRA